MNTFPTGAPMLDGAIITLIRYARENNEPLTAPNLSLLGAQRFNDTFPELQQVEVDDAIAWLAANEAPDVGPDPVAIGNEEAAAFNAHRERQRGPVQADDAETVETKPAPEISREAAQENVRLASDNLARARRDLVAAQSESRTARGVLSQCVLAWQRNGTAPMTQDDLKREFLRSEQMEREANGPYRSSAQSAKNFTRKRMVNGGNRRGSFSQLELLSMTPEEKRAAVAAHNVRMRRELARLKLPSQR